MKYLEIIDSLENANIKDENMKNTIKNIQNTESYMKKLNYIELDEKLLKIDMHNISFDKDKDMNSQNDVTKQKKYLTNKFFGEMKFLNKNNLSIQYQDEEKFKHDNKEKKRISDKNYNNDNFIKNTNSYKNSLDLNSIELIEDNVEEMSKIKHGDFKDYLTNKINGFYNNNQRDLKNDNIDNISQNSDFDRKVNNNYILNNANKVQNIALKRIANKEENDIFGDEKSFNSNRSNSPKERRISNNKLKTKKIVQELKGYKKKVKSKKNNQSEQLLTESAIDQEVYQENIFKIVGHFDNFINLIENLNNTFEKMNESLKKLKKDNNYYFDKMFRIDEKLNDLEEKQLNIEEKLKSI